MPGSSSSSSSGSSSSGGSKKRQRAVERNWDQMKNLQEQADFRGWQEEFLRTSIENQDNYEGSEGYTIRLSQDAASQAALRQANADFVATMNAKQVTGAPRVLATDTEYEVWRAKVEKINSTFFKKDNKG